MTTPIETLIIYGLACFRLALLLGEDQGPWAVFQKLRSFLKREAKHNTPLRQSKVHLGITCTRCNSVWMAAPIALFDCGRNSLPFWCRLTGDGILLCLALSALAILIHRIPKR